MGCRCSMSAPNAKIRQAPDAQSAGSEQVTSSQSAGCMSDPQKSLFCSGSESECCVCFLSTNLVTPCGHVLCQQCRPGLRDNRCPMCRADLPLHGWNGPFAVEDDDSE